MTTKTTRTKKAAKKKGKKKMNLNELNNLKETYEKALREKGQEIMKEAIEAFFKANPKITGVTWTQYTPYFNDGDECIFGVHEPAFSVSEVDVDGVPDYAEGGEGGFFNSYDFKLYNLSDPYYKGKDWAIEHNQRIEEAMETAKVDRSVFEQAGETFTATVGAAPNELFKAAFGDHQRVVLTPDEIYTEECQHN